MPIQIHRLTCRVTVKTGAKTSPLHSDTKSERPSMTFVMPAPESKTSADSNQAQAHSGEESATETKTMATPNRADPRAVADRVYDLMKQEIYLDRLRGGSGRNNQRRH